MTPEEASALAEHYSRVFGPGHLCTAPNCIHWYRGGVPQGEVRRVRGRWVTAWFERHSITYNHGKLCADTLTELVKLGAPTFKTPLEALKADSR